MSESRTTPSPAAPGSSSAGDAGGFEQQRYEEGLRAWRRRVLPRVRWLVFPVVWGCALFLVLGPVSKLQFPAGLLAGGLLSLYRGFAMSRPSTSAGTALGPRVRSTARVIAPLLTEGWRVAHNIDTGRGNGDHVLIRPGGLFLLDSKKLGGTVAIDGETVHVERVDDPAISTIFPV